MGRVQPSKRVRDRDRRKTSSTMLFGLLRRVGRLHPELLRPGDERPEDEEVGPDHEDHHGDDGDDHLAEGALLHRRAHVAADAREVLGVPLPWMNTVTASDAVRKNHPPPIDIIMFQTRPIMELGHVELPEPLPLGEPVHARRLVELGGLRDQRVVEAECHVPRLRGEDHEDRRHLHAEQAAREEVDEDGQGDRQEDQDGDRLEDVEDGDQDLLRPSQPRRGHAVDEGEHRREPRAQ